MLSSRRYPASARQVIVSGCNGKTSVQAERKRFPTSERSINSRGEDCLGAAMIRDHARLRRRITEGSFPGG
jgi:hypothetical protein